MALTLNLDLQKLKAVQPDLNRNVVTKRKESQWKQDFNIWEAISSAALEIQMEQHGGLGTRPGQRSETDPPGLTVHPKQRIVNEQLRYGKPSFSVLISRNEKQSFLRMQVKFWNWAIRA